MARGETKKRKAPARRRKDQGKTRTSENRQASRSEEKEEPGSMSEAAGC